VTTSKIQRLEVRSTEEPLFKELARKVNPPDVEESGKTEFIPAYAGFDIGEGSQVDISYFYSPPSDRPWETPKTNFDRHWHTEELWVVVQGDFLLPLAKCREPNNPDEVPRAEDMHLFAVKEGDLFVVRPNVWHTGPWAASPGQPYTFYMMLSGHRKATEDENVDYTVHQFPEDVAILPALDADGQPVYVG
jgi:mannose-6-phosphate isomerase-like protein (cupin superfamily)